ncbi:MAG: hypothetical protein AAF773_28395 [Cyanobacteria bacterium P01_D01_bin.115]
MPPYQHLRESRYPVWASKARAITLGTAALLVSAPAFADVPEQTRVDDILGNSSELRIRRSGRPESIQTGSILQQVRDALITVPPNNARALLRFLAADGTDLNFYVQTNPHPEASIYYFPCQVQGGDYLIGWGLAGNESRGCENGLQVERGRSGVTGWGELDAPMAIAPKQLAQSPVRQVSYCSAGNATGGLGFATATTGDPCIEAVEQCQAAGGDCDLTALGSWWTSEPAIEAALICDTTVQTVTGTGDDIADLIPSLLPNATGSGCSVQIYRPNDVVIVPAADAVVTAQGSDEVLVQTRDTDDGVQVDVLKGAINVQATGLAEPAVVTQGERYTYANSNGEVTTFDRAAALTSVDMEVLCAFATNSPDRLQVTACQEGLGIDTVNSPPIAFCNTEQASGGQEGDRRIVQMSARQGEIELEYEMYNAPDRLQIRQDGQEIFDTGFVSGNAALTIPFSGQSGSLEVIVTGNSTIDTTEWDYLLRCP